MKLKFAATSSATSYTINGETINGIDLSVIEHGGKFVGNDETRAAGIRDAYRDENGEVHVVLKQATIASKMPKRKAHWREGPEIDAADYDSAKCYVIPTGVSDLTEGEDYEIVWGTDVAGSEGWTIVEAS